MHGELSETASFSACDSREPLLTWSLLSDPSHNHGSLLCSDPKGAEKGPTGVTPPTSSCNCRLAGPVPLRLSALSRLTYCYLRTVTWAMALLYRVIVLREDRILQSE